jgi:D-glycero-D-manno-heptose 1,7-bisphosphate phosphatase
VSRLRPALFLDRDGVLTREDDWVLAPHQVELLPGAAEGLRRLNLAGVPAVVVTNQSALARGWIDERGLAAIHARLAELLAEQGARVDAIYHCPHHPTAGAGDLTRACDCRKPEPGLLVRAARELGLDLSASWMVGDAGRDLEAAWRAGARAALVRSGKGAAELGRLARAPDLVCDTLDEAVRAILPRIGAALRADGA